MESAVMTRVAEVLATEGGVAGVVRFKTRPAKKITEIEYDANESWREMLARTFTASLMRMQAVHLRLSWRGVWGYMPALYERDAAQPLRLHLGLQWLTKTTADF